ncbi:lipoprotein insertase outer membrane protein LolB [Undibacterium oligocarboniphilum]|uniref:Outer-membrane lipoprotein LolB n=1 Tax=Undibacterium oligocarboniphilum TaxID=666702 RepID=A0A850QHB4_9BURK|nr:lipoprotein insertase outer membrane protein LolB [Undibacterium oligocarboniphilum]MBC3870521.1 outer membrane lipoprotein LolB [Undibacterium oligocarboniphilum]NVO78678.1 outer membrane lipoprotein LolB [Undibacterium oligocarboniphilum]
MSRSHSLSKITGTLALYCCAFLGSGCTTQAPLQTSAARATSSANAAETPARLYQNQIQLSGKISVRYEQNGKPQNLTGNFEWHQQDENLEILLSSPLGQTLARITQNKQGALLEQDGKIPRQASDLDQLISDTLHWPLPVSGLRDWLQGFVRTKDGHPLALLPTDQTMEADGWKIRYASWHQSPVQPRRMDLSRYSQTAGEVSLSIYLEPYFDPLQNP